jgi:hypothetical protein
MNFEQFQATRRYCTDLGKVLSDAQWEGEPNAKGNLYLGILYIDEVQDHWPDAARAKGKWHLILDRREWISDDLESLERKLFDFAMSAGYADDKAINCLIDEYAEWNKAQGLSLGSADEHFFDESLTDEQRKWLRDFSRRWEIAA